MCIANEIYLGGLDPWTSGGVTQNVSSSLISIILDLGPSVSSSCGDCMALLLQGLCLCPVMIRYDAVGAHHLDLFFETPEDPPCAKQARDAEEQVSCSLYRLTCM